MTSHIRPDDGARLYRMGFSWYNTHWVYETNPRGPQFPKVRIGLKYYMTYTLTPEQVAILPTNAEHIGSHVTLFTKSYMLRKGKK